MAFGKLNILLPGGKRLVSLFQISGSKLADEVSDILIQKLGDKGYLVSEVDLDNLGAIERLMKGELMRLDYPVLN